MWEISGRTRLPGADNHLPITSHLVPRLIDAGVTVCIAPAGGGDSLEERDDTAGFAGRQFARARSISHGHRAIQRPGFAAPHQVRYSQRPDQG